MRLRHIWRTSTCIFPEANTPFKKAICAATGIAAVGTGSCIGVYATMYGVESIMNSPSRKVSTEKIEKKPVIIINKTSRFGKWIDANSDKRWFNNTTFVGGMGLGGAATVGSALLARDFCRNWSKETDAFVKAVTGTKCCNIVRATGRYSIFSFTYTLAIPGTVFMTLFWGSSTFECADRLLRQDFKTFKDY